MANSVAFKLVLLLLVAISMPLLDEARSLGVGVYHDDLQSSLLPLPQTAKETLNSDDDDALLGNNGIASASPLSPHEVALHLHRLVRSAPSPRPLPHRPRSGGAGQLSACSGGPEVGGAHKPSAPPPPGGPKPPHRSSSEQGGPRPRPMAVDVSDVLLLRRVLQRLAQGGSSSAVRISDVVRGV